MHVTTYMYVANISFLWVVSCYQHINLLAPVYVVCKFVLILFTYLGMEDQMRYEERKLQKGLS